MQDATRDELIKRVVAAEFRLRRLFAYDRSNPLLSVNLTMQQLKVMLLVSTHEDLTTQELTRLLAVSMPTVTGLVDRLAGQGYVERHEDTHDRRVRRVGLTGAGRRLVSEIVDAGAEHQRRLFARLDEDTLGQLEHVLTKITEAAHADARERGQPLPD